jgi:predicted flap endonuclease-1-like 5' DNA nuclease
MFENLTPDMVFPVAGFVVGALITFIYSQRKINKRDDQIQDQESKIKDLNKNLKKTNDTVKDLNKELGRRDETIESLSTQVAERNDSIDTLRKEKEDLDSRTRREFAERDERAREMEIDLEKRDETIGSLENQLEERHIHVKVLDMEIADLGERNRESMNRAEEDERRIVELENEKQERDDEITRLKAKQRAMIDDFTKIDGIGPKMSSVLRFSGIKTFSKLASVDAAELREILVAENPSLLRLTDPSTWSEQARMAAEGEWEALEALQESFKESRRRERTMLQSTEADIPSIVTEI